MTTQGLHYLTLPLAKLRSTPLLLAPLAGSTLIRPTPLLPAPLAGSTLIRPTPLLPAPLAGSTLIRPTPLLLAPLAGSTLIRPFASGQLINVDGTPKFQTNESLLQHAWVRCSVFVVFLMVSEMENCTHISKKKWFCLMRGLHANIGRRIKA
ncbi:hypothetical protein FN846DRAFT_148070 [Sphaerosporella brunnea]|uniref:Uncharacterized protein n=1 Tax=Sphaerosporella brunnea TaxID=1250544 RepID=A0A5J5ES16_9PEZI|nr:hypothetical protein FN846DRAFT_148070 [Sphaerosporella brunnea]